MTLWAQQLTCTRGDRVLFDGLDLELHRGDAVRVAGNNGAGKTTLLRILCGLVQPATGAVYWDSENIRSAREQFHNQLVYIGHLSGIKEDLTACENVMLSARLSGNRIDRKAAIVALQEIGLGAQIKLPARVLSQGQKKRVALARLAFCSDRPLWMLDEPLVALDPDAVQSLTTTINHHLANKGMVVYSTHQEWNLVAERNQTVELAGVC
jgi:heme exporter protein A